MTGSHPAGPREDPTNPGSSAAEVGREPWRRFALFVLLLGIGGAAIELVLLGHTEDRMQWVPLVLLAAGFVTGLALAVHASRPVLATFGTVMGLYVPAAVVGIYLHLKSNVEFELEMRPSMEGTELALESLQGAMPALAPGTMAYLGLIGLLVWYRHPLPTDDQEDDQPSKQE